MWSTNFHLRTINSIQFNFFIFCFLKNWSWSSIVTKNTHRLLQTLQSVATRRWTAELSPHGNAHSEDETSGFHWCWIPHTLLPGRTRLDQLPWHQRAGWTNPAKRSSISAFLPDEIWTSCWPSFTKFFQTNESSIQQTLIWIFAHSVRWLLTVFTASYFFKRKLKGVAFSLTPFVAMILAFKKQENRPGACLNSSYTRAWFNILDAHKVLRRPICSSREGTLMITQSAAAK